MLKIAIGGDHAGFEYKKEITELLNSQAVVTDFGPTSTDSCDYPDHAHPLAEAVQHGTCDFGILICGSGNGVCITANKHAGIRAALCWNVELAALARQHNNANVLCLPARFIDLPLAKEITLTFLSTAFEGGRHQKRVDKIDL
jgi:ribose 5-phosphate isomerase B